MVLPYRLSQPSNHQGGRAQIKPAVVRYLKENRYQYREVDGVVFIRIR